MCYGCFDKPRDPKKMCRYPCCTDRLSQACKCHWQHSLWQMIWTWCCSVRREYVLNVLSYTCTHVPGARMEHPPFDLVLLGQSPVVPGW